MTDYSRPQAQWQDLPSTGSVLVPWSLNYDPTTGVVTLNEFFRSDRSGLVLDSDDETSRTWRVVERVNGEPEVAVAYATNETVQLFA